MRGNGWCSGSGIYRLHWTGTRFHYLGAFCVVWFGFLVLRTKSRTTTALPLSPSLSTVFCFALGFSETQLSYNTGWPGTMWPAEPWILGHPSASASRALGRHEHVTTDSALSLFFLKRTILSSRENLRLTAQGREPQVQLRTTMMT